MTEPLTKLTKKDQPWVWGEAQEQAFTAIKAKLVERPVLCIFDPKRPTEVHTDASSLEAGAVLLQEVNGRMAAVAYFSKQTTNGAITRTSWKRWRWFWH